MGEGKGRPIRVRILGCGSSGGVPRIGGDWGACDPSEPRNRRMRCSLLIRRGATTILIDTSPDLREQLLAAGTTHVTAVFLTHGHADQLHGIDDLRALYLRNHYRRIPLFADPETLSSVQARFDYCFESVLAYPAILSGHAMTTPVTIGVGEDAVTLEPLVLRHGAIDALGFRIGGLAYMPDVSDVPDDVWPKLEGLEYWIVDALRDRPHPSHAHVERTLSWIARAQPRQAVLTNMHVDLDYRELAARCPDGVEPGYDGMELSVTA